MPLPTTKSYVADADADTYFIDTPRHAEWFALSVGEKTVALHSATRALEGLCYLGEPCSPTQPLKWPRVIAATNCCTAADCTTIPKELVEATCELALQLHNNPNILLTVQTATTGTFVKRQKLGDLEVEFDQFAAGTANGSAAPKGPAVLTTFPWLKDVLRCYYSGAANSNLMLRVRS